MTDKQREGEADTSLVNGPAGDAEVPPLSNEAIMAMRIDQLDEDDDLPEGDWPDREEARDRGV